MFMMEQLCMAFKDTYFLPAGYKESRPKDINSKLHTWLVCAVESFTKALKYTGPLYRRSSTLSQALLYLGLIYTIPGTSVVCNAKSNI